MSNKKPSNFVKIHHVEMCLQNEVKIRELFKHGFLFQETHFRQNQNGLQRAYQWKNTKFVTTVKENKLCDSNNILQYPMLFCNSCNNESQVDHIDAVFNICLEVKCIQDILDRVSIKNVNDIIHKVKTIQDQFGCVKIAIIKAPCGNVIHTLIEKENYLGTFLPGFIELSNKVDENNALSTSRKNYLTSIDHVTYACLPGESSYIIKWYEEIFAMHRFLLSK